MTLVDIAFFLTGCAVGVLGSFYVSKYFHGKSQQSQQETDRSLSDIRALVTAIHRNVTADVFRNVAKPILRSVHRYVSGLVSLCEEIKQLKKAGSNRKVQMLVGEIEILHESLSDTLNVGETRIAEQTDPRDKQ